MQPSRRHCLYASLALMVVTLTFVAWAPQAFAENLTITSSPPGATVEIDGMIAGTTPYHVDYPGSYFHKPHTVFTARLEHAMLLRISKDGFRAQQITMSSGPFQWIGLTGKRHGTYFLLVSDRFDITLEPASESAVTAGETGAHAGPIRPRNALGQFVSPTRAADAASENPVARSGAETQPAGTGSIAIASEPIGADIYVDGNFVGQTPSTIRLPAGRHQVEVKSQGKQNWTRDLQVLKESELTLRAVLVDIGSSP